MTPEKSYFGMRSLKQNFVGFYLILLPKNILVSILKPYTIYEFTLKDSFHFTEEIVDQQSDFFMDSVDVNFLFTNIPLEEIIQICK